MQNEMKGKHTKKKEREGGVGKREREMVREEKGKKQERGQRKCTPPGPLHCLHAPLLKSFWTFLLMLTWHLLNKQTRKQAASRVGVIFP